MRRWLIGLLTAVLLVGILPAFSCGKSENVTTNDSADIENEVTSESDVQTDNEETSSSDIAVDTPSVTYEGIDFDSTLPGREWVQTTFPGVIEEPKIVIYNDETNGHVDNMCNFVRPGVVVLAWTNDKKDPQYARSKAALEYLESEKDAMGRKIEVHKLLTPKPILITKEESEGVDAVDGTLPRQKGDRMAASYVNYYTCNGAVILPVFNDPHDELAKEKLQELYPDRKVETIYAREILLGGGNIHCITQQVPRG